VCGEIFYSNNKHSKCCTDQCSGTFGILSPIKQFGEPQYIEKAICKNCSCEFDVKKGNAKYRIFCNENCNLEFNLNKIKEEFLNKTFSKLYIMDITREKEKSGKIRFYAHYKCECGTIGKTTVDNIRINQTLSCGCYSKERNWKGGITLIKSYLRDKISEWKLKSMKYSKYKCLITEKPFDDIHHLYPFHKIVDETFEITNIERKKEVNEYTLEELKLLEDTCLQLHYKYPLGVCLTHEIHSLFHSLYGHSEFTPEDYYEFTERYLSGEFNTED
jgi:hypothetical protein